jgi:hypothetical protein
MITNGLASRLRLSWYRQDSQHSLHNLYSLAPSASMDPPAYSTTVKECLTNQDFRDHIDIHAVPLRHSFGNVQYVGTPLFFFSAPSFLPEKKKGQRIYPTRTPH